MSPLELAKTFLDKDSNAVLTTDAQVYVDKAWPCEGPADCNSHGICSNCIDKLHFRIGYAFAAKGIIRGIESLNTWPDSEEIALKKVEILNKSSGSINQIFDECIKWLKERE